MPPSEKKGETSTTRGEIFRPPLFGIPPPSSEAPGGYMPPRFSTISLNATMDAAYRAGFRTESKLVTITSIAIGESNLNPRARHSQPEYGPDQYDRGLWQISTHWYPQYTDAQCDDPVQAAAIAYRISSRGTNFTRWDAYNSGALQVHYDLAIGGWPAIRPLVRMFLAGRG